MDTTTIHYTTLPCALGWLLVARTARGVCNVRFGDAPEPLEAGLREVFPFAELVRDPGRLASCVEALRGFLDGSRRRLDFPLDVRGSQFQRRVWDAILAIPYGETRSYGELARSIGRPRACRAVAGACGANPVALAIPCHRVVSANGDGGGYRWGVERKRAIQEVEQKESDKSLSNARISRWPVPRLPSRSRPAAAQPVAGSSTPPSTA